MELEVVRHALKTARRLGYGEVELTMGEDSFAAKLMPDEGSEEVTASSEPAKALPPASPKAISAPVVGYYQEGEVTLKPGASVSAGDIVAVIVALGIANDVESKWGGIVDEVLVEPGQAVQYGQPLALLISEE